MKRWILALALCLTLCMLVCFAAADGGAAMVLPEGDEVAMDRTVRQGDTVTLQTPIGQNIGAIKLTIKDTAGWGVTRTETKSVGEAGNGKLSFSFGTDAQSSFQPGHQYYVELMAMQTQDSAPTEWKSYWDRILTVIPNDSPAGLQMFFNSTETQANTYEAPTGFFSLYVTAYDPQAENVWIVFDGEVIQAYNRNCTTASFRFNESGTHEFYAVSMKADGTRTTSDTKYVQFKQAENPDLYINGLTPVSYLDGSIEDLPGTITAGTDLSYTIHAANQPNLGTDAAGNEQQIWYDVWMDDLSTEDDRIELPCYRRRQEPEVPQVSGDLLLNESTGDRTVRIADYCELQAGHSYQLNIDIRSAGCTPVQYTKNFTVLPAEMDSEHTITLGFTGNSEGQNTAEIRLYDKIRLHASAPGATVVRFWNGYRFEYLNSWIGGDWTGEFDFDQKAWNTGSNQFYIQAYYGETDETPWDQMEWDPACISNILTVNATEDDNIAKVVPEYEALDTTIEQGDYFTVNLTNTDEIDQAGAYAGADLSNGNEIRNHFDRSGNKILIPTADLEPGYYCLSIYTETPGAGYASNPSFFRVNAAASYPDNGFMITTTAAQTDDGTYTVQSYENFGVTFYAPEKEGYTRYYRFFDGQDWWRDNWFERSVTLDAELDPGTWEIYAEAVYEPEEDGQDEIRLESGHLTITAGSRGDSGVFLDAPGSYSTGENGYTVSLRNAADNALIDPTQYAGEYWEMRLEEMNGRELAFFRQGNGEPLQNSYTFADELFETGKTYRIRFHMNVQGYDPAEDEVCFAAVSTETVDQERLELLVNGSDNDIGINAHEEFSIKVNKSDDITAVRVLNGDGWEYWWGGDDYERVWNFGFGTFGMIAQGTTAEAVWEGEEFDWENFDWNNVDWNVISNMVTVKINCPNGRLGMPGLTLDRDACTRGEKITATVEKADGSVWYDLHMAACDEFGNVQGDVVYDAHTESTGTGTIGFIIPTAHLEPGMYTVWVDNGGYGWQGNGSSRRVIRVEEGEQEPSTVLELPDSIQTNENIDIYAYVPGADGIRLEIRKAGEDGWQNGWESDRNYGTWEFGEAFRGTYIFTLYGRANGEEFQAAGPATLEVTAEHGDLEDVVFSGLPDVLTLNSNNGISGSFTKDGCAEWYHVRMVYRGPSGDWEEEEIESDFRDGENIGNTLTYTPDAFGRTGIYEIQVFGGATGYNGTDNRKRILVTHQQDESGEHLTLTVNGSTEERQDILSSRSIRVQVAYEERPTAVRVLNGDHFEYWWGEEESFERDWNFGEGEIFLYAEATRDPIDFDMLEETGWEDFDWDEDASWSEISNIIVLNIINPYGEMAAPTFTLTGLDENGLLPWGEDLILRVSDPGPMGISPGEETAELIRNGWFYLNMDAEQWNENGPWWDRVSDGFDYHVRSGENRIPTYMLEGGCRYRIEIGADAEGYSGNSTWVEFTLGEREEPEEPISEFRVNGITEDAITVQTHEELQLTAYRSGAEWYDIVITREDDESWQDSRSNSSNGILMDWWQTDSEGTYLLKAYAYGYHYDENGSIIQDENGYDIWEEEMGTVTLTAEAIHGDLGELHATMDDKAYIGDPIEITFEAVTGEDLNAEEAEYSYWIHTDSQDEWVMGGSRYGAGPLTIDTGRLNSGVYWVELDAMATGYNQAHATMHFALLDRNDTVYTDKTRYFSVSTLSVPTDTDVRIIGYLPGADGIRLAFRKDNNTEAEIIEERDGPGISTWFSRGDSGNYQMCLSRRTENGWSEPETVCTLEITADNSFENDPSIVINGSHEGNTVPADENNPQRMTVEIARDTNARGYQIRIGEYGDGWPVFEQFIDPDNPEEDERISIGENEIIIVLEDECIRPGRIYEADCRMLAPGYETRGAHRMFVLQGDGTDPDFTLEISTQDPEGQYWTGENAWVFAKATDAEAIKVCMNNETRFYRGDRIGESFMIWDQESLFHAYATNDPIPEDDNFNWDDLNVNWSRQAEPVLIQANTEGPTEVPSLIFDSHVTRGDWFEFTIGDDGDARQMDLRIQDEQGNEMEFRRYQAPGTYRLPTANLNPGQRYKVFLNCVQDRHLWTSGPEKILYVDEPQEPESAFFRVDKTTLYPGERFIPTIYAAGANHLWISDEHWDMNPENHEGVWGDWEGENGTNHADWEWQYDNPGEYVLIGWARYENLDDITEIGRIQITVVEAEPLERAQILVPDEVDATDSFAIYIDPVENGHYYSLKIHGPGDPEPCYTMTKTAQDIDLDHGHLAFAIDANTLQPNRSYWIDCFVEPEHQDYAHRGSDSSKNIMTRAGEGTDSNITIRLNGNWDHEDEDDMPYRYLIPVNTGFDITVSAGPTAGLPTAIAVYMGDHTEYRFFNDADGFADEETVGMSEYQAWPENIFARACYEDLSGYGDYENVPWEELEWGAPSNAIHVRFTDSGRAEPAAISNHYATIAGRNIIVQVTPGENADEAHGNLDFSSDGEEDLVYGEWFPWEEDPENPGTGIITIPTDGLPTGGYRLHVDNSGAGYANNRTTTMIRIVEDPYQSASKLALPGSLTTIEEEAFEGINADTVIIPDGVTTIGRRAFADSNVRLVVIPDSVTEIGEEAFANSNLDVIYGFGGEKAPECANEYDVTFCYAGD